MNKFLRFSFVAVLMAICNVAFADEAKFDFAANGLTMFPGITEVSTSDSHAGDFTEAKSTVVNGVTLTVNPTASGAANRFWTNYNSNKVELRIYSASIDFTAPTGKAIKKIVFDITGVNKSPEAPTVNIGTLTGGTEAGTATWEGNATKVIFTHTKSVFYASATVTFETADANTDQGGGITPEPPVEEEGIVFNFDDNYATLFPSLAGVSSSASGDTPASTKGDFPAGETVSEAVDGATVSIFTADDQKNPNRIWSTSPRLRLYGGALTINAPSGQKMTGVVFHLASTKSASKWNEGNTFSSGTGALAEDGKSFVWAGDPTGSLSVSIAGNTQISKIVITFGAVEHSLTISGTTPFEESTTVTITSTSSSASIYYTIDGSDPADESNINAIQYTAPFELTATATVKAFDESTGVSAEKEFVKKEEVACANIAEFNALNKGDNAILTLTNAKAVYVWTSDKGTKKAYIRDASGCTVFFNTGLEINTNDDINGTVILKKDVYNKLDEAIKIEGKTNADNLTIQAGEEAKPAVIPLDAVPNHVADLIQVVGSIVVKTDESDANKTYTYLKSGETEYQLYDSFHLNNMGVLEAGMTYTIIGIAEPYKTTFEIYPITITEGGVEIIKGDIDGSGEVNTGDVTALYNVIFGTDTTTDKSICDVDGTGGDPNTSDVTALYNIIFGTAE
ncbi:MAG: chitobiase/beta-hexosaminidase C-terminal domain-containing protein [Prevotella sp.]|nr:chitobiase/beta-hexosaminidase C-terminal domain-containing protein [Prevotella sp.]